MCAIGFCGWAAAAGACGAAAGFTGTSGSACAAISLHFFFWGGAETAAGVAAASRYEEPARLRRDQTRCGSRCSRSRRQFWFGLTLNRRDGLFNFSFANAGRSNRCGRNHRYLRDRRRFRCGCCRFGREQRCRAGKQVSLPPGAGEAGSPPQPVLPVSAAPREPFVFAGSLQRVAGLSNGEKSNFGLSSSSPLLRREADLDELSPPPWRKCAFTFSASSTLIELE